MIQFIWLSRKGKFIGAETDQYLPGAGDKEKGCLQKGTGDFFYGTILWMWLWISSCMHLSKFKDTKFISITKISFMKIFLLTYAYLHNGVQTTSVAELDFEGRVKVIIFI